MNLCMKNSIAHSPFCLDSQHNTAHFVWNHNIIQSKNCTVTILRNSHFQKMTTFEGGQVMQTILEDQPINSSSQVLKDVEVE